MLCTTSREMSFVSERASKNGDGTCFACVSQPFSIIGRISTSLLCKLTAEIIDTGEYHPLPSPFQDKICDEEHTQHSRTPRIP